MTSSPSHRPGFSVWRDCIVTCGSSGADTRTLEGSWLKKAVSTICSGGSSGRIRDVWLKVNEDMEVVLTVWAKVGEKVGKDLRPGRYGCDDSVAVVGGGCKDGGRGGDG
jgi:hypothetical protein